MFREGRALRKFFRVVFLQRHMPDTPGVERDFQRRFEWRARRVFDLEKRFHQLRRFPRSAQDREILARLREGCAVGCDRSIILHSQKQILFRFGADLGKEHPRQKRRAINLFESILQYGAERIMRQASQ